MDLITHMEYNLNKKRQILVDKDQEDMITLESFMIS